MDQNHGEPDHLDAECMLGVFVMLAAEVHSNPVIAQCHRNLISQ